MTTAYGRVHNPGPIETYGIVVGSLATYSSMLAARANRASHADGDYILVNPTAEDSAVLSEVYRYDAVNGWFIPPWWYAQTPRYKIISFEGNESATDLTNLGYTVTQTGGGTVATDGTKITFDASGSSTDRAHVLREESALNPFAQVHMYAQGWLRGATAPTTTHGENCCIRFIARIGRGSLQVRRSTAPADSVVLGSSASTFLLHKVVTGSVERFCEIELFSEQESSGDIHVRGRIGVGLAFGTVKEADMSNFLTGQPTQGLIGCASSGQGKLEARELVVYAVQRSS